MLARAPAERQLPSRRASERRHLAPAHPQRAQIDLTRVPEFDLDPAGLPPNDDWIQKSLRRPALPIGAGSSDGRALYPDEQAATYHQVQRQDYAWPCIFAMARNLPMDLRLKFAKAAIQRQIDILGCEPVPASAGREAPTSTRGRRL